MISEGENCESLFTNKGTWYNNVNGSYLIEVYCQEISLRAEFKKYVGVILRFNGVSFTAAAQIKTFRLDEKVLNYCLKVLSEEKTLKKWIIRETLLM